MRKPDSRQWALVHVVGALLIVLCGCDQAGLVKATSTRSEEPLIDILFYACADNKDRENVSADVRELMEGSPAPGYQFWLLYDAPSAQGSPKPGLYRGQNGYWEMLPLSTIDLPQDAQLNMGDGGLLGAVLSHVFPGNSERGSALILSGETGTLYEGLILDQGSDDYLQAEELARALAGRGVDLVVLDSGFSAGFEFLYEIGKTLEEPPLMLLSSGPFPREGRNYGRLFSSYPAQETFRPQDFSVHIQDEFTRAHGSDPRSRQLIADPAGAQSFMGHFNALLAAVHSEIDTDLKRKGLRSELMFASPSYYETPGNLHIAPRGDPRELPAGTRR